MTRLPIVAACLLCLLDVSALQAQTTKDAVKFNRDIRPILVDKCFACHGPDAETVSGGLRVDIREEAIDMGAIDPGNADDSELVSRIYSDDNDQIMPPPESHKQLNENERALLRRWIEEGATYETHWSYNQLAAPQPPKLEPASESRWEKAWPSNSIDQFISKQLLEAKTRPNKQADRVTLIRRLSFDLTGLPPTLSEVEAFANDQSQDAYSKLVERLLASPRFGERMAIHWLDLVRYADTVGYHGDQDISQSPYRDYVINAFNSNMRYDQFVREQLAGDLLPDPTIQQLVASGYNRLNQTTEEGGAQPKEYLAIYFADRVRNVSQVFMGATVGCAQCHDHKFDPYTAKDFYALGAFFADIQEVGLYSARKRPPMIPVPTASEAKQLSELAKQITDKQREYSDAKKQVLVDQANWEVEALAQNANAKIVEHVWIDDKQNTGGPSSGDWNFVDSSADPVRHGKLSRRQESAGLVQHYFLGSKQKVLVDANTVFYSWVFLDPKNPPKSIMLQFNNGNWDHRAVWGSNEIQFGRRPKSWAGYFRNGKLPETGKWVRLEVNAADVGLGTKDKVEGMAFTQFGGVAHWDAAGWVASDGLPSSIAAILEMSPSKRNAKQKKAIEKYYLGEAELTSALNKRLQSLEAAQKTLLDSVTKTVVTKSVKPRAIRVLHRGNWMDEDGEIVEPAIPAFLGKLDTNGKRATRLDLANWICEPDNVLTSRTFVNRMWALMFGRGICTSVDDMGGQGTFPSNPELLDWLAVDFVRSGWDIKHTLRTIVMSSAYRQSSKPSADSLNNDPYNNLFARQGRFRVEAEMVRDTALSVSGLLVEQIGGKSTKPYQPSGYYAQLNFPVRTYMADADQNQYRRGVYTHWQRTFLHPMLKAFDAPSREEGVCSRARSNTPLQALALLNDPTFVEAARVYAERIIANGGATVDERIHWAYQNAISREPQPAIVAELRKVFESHHEQFKSNLESAKALLATGQSAVPSEIDKAELAAWTSVARVILNLHELTMRY